MSTPTSPTADLAAWARLAADVTPNVTLLPKPVLVTYHGTVGDKHGPALIIGACDCLECSLLPAWERCDVLVTPSGAVLNNVHLDSYDLAPTAIQL